MRKKILAMYTHAVEILHNFSFIIFDFTSFLNAKSSWKFYTFHSCCYLILFFFLSIFFHLFPPTLFYYYYLFPRLISHERKPRVLVLLVARLQFNWTIVSNANAIKLDFETGLNLLLFVPLVCTTTRMKMKLVVWLFCTDKQWRRRW